MCHLYNSYCNNLDIFRKGWRHAQSPINNQTTTTTRNHHCDYLYWHRNSKDFSSSLSRQYCWSILFYLLLQFKIVPLTWVEDGANFLLKTMVFFFIPSVVGIMDVASEITLNYILFFAVIIIGTCIVALSSGYIAEKCLLNISNVKV